MKFGPVFDMNVSKQPEKLRMMAQSNWSIHQSQTLRGTRALNALNAPYALYDD
jgi:hypothetical protein